MRFVPIVKKLCLSFLVMWISIPTLSEPDYTDGALYRNNFENMSNGSNWFHQDTKVQDYTQNGTDGKILKMQYVSTDKGTQYVQKKFYLNREVNEATLSFDVKLHSQFEFVRGGKMHGLAGGNATTGCKPIDPNGWSVRMVWRSVGRPVLYVYHQDRANRCGDDIEDVTGFAFERGKWYRVDLHVKINSGIGSADGIAALYINGIKRAERTDLNLTGNLSKKIDNFLFSTFYGGSDSTWSPSKTTYAYYDNFTVMPGRVIYGVNGTQCDIFEEGIFNPSNQACCKDTCGACGGAGCGQLPGGSENCCSGTVLHNGKRCNVNGVEAPCSM